MNRNPYEPEGTFGEEPAALPSVRVKAVVGRIQPRTTLQFARHILNHYDRNSHKDHLCLARRLEKWAITFTANAEAQRSPASGDKLPPLVGNSGGGQ